MKLWAAVAGLGLLVSSSYAVTFPNYFGTNVVSSGGGGGGSTTTPGGVSGSIQFNNGTSTSLGGGTGLTTDGLGQISATSLFISSTSGSISATRADANSVLNLSRTGANAGLLQVLFPTGRSTLLHNALFGETFSNTGVWVGLNPGTAGNTPSATLHVNGTTRIVSNLTVGANVTSTVNGADIYGTTSTTALIVGSGGCTGCGGGQISSTYLSTPGAVTFTTPVGTTANTNFKIIITGGGSASLGGGGAGSSAGSAAAGATAIKYFSGFPSGTAFSIRIGAGGLVATPRAGQSSTIVISGTTITANGGNADYGQGAGGNPGATGGLATSGDVNIAGGDGGAGIGSATGNISGAGGASYWGGGGAGVGGATGATNNGISGKACGSGASSGAGSGAGAAGANGCALIEWTQ